MVVTAFISIECEVLEMTKAYLADLIHERLSCQKREAVELVDLTLDILKEAIATEGHVK